MVEFLREDSVTLFGNLTSVWLVTYTDRPRYPSGDGLRIAYGNSTKKVKH